MTSAVVAALSVAACGNLSQGGIGAQAVGMLMGAGGMPSPQVTVSGADMMASPGTYMQVNTRATGAWDTLVKGGENAGRETWIGTTGRSYTFEDGVVVATRGLSRDMMGADASVVWQAISAGGGSYVRQQDYLNDLDQIDTFVLQCVLTAKGSDPASRDDKSIPANRFEEQCQSENLSFSNIYWLGADGKMLRSLQAVSPDAGYLQIEVF